MAVKDHTNMNPEEGHQSKKDERLESEYYEDKSLREREDRSERFIDGEIVKSTKTMRECKDIVGKNNGFPLSIYLSNIDATMKNIIIMVEEYCKLYYTQKFDKKSLLDFKNEISQRYGYNSYEHYTTIPSDRLDREHDDWEFHLSIIDEATELYARQFMNHEN
ncbi:MAG: hypothetical protein WC380_00085 [Pedobacter sp.]|jgi:hypothetical protein